MIGDLLKKDIEDLLSITGPVTDTGIQTLAMLFENTSYHWEIIKKAFVEACETKPVMLRAWAFIERPGIESVSVWHVHPEYDHIGHRIQCGVMYLDEFKHGTMFKIGNEEIIGDPTPFVWHMFPPGMLHRPPDWDTQSTVTRYVIAADAYDVSYI